MSNVLDYIKWRGDLSFSVSPFNETDSLIFTQLVYLDFREVFKKNRKKLRLEDMGRRYFQLHSKKKLLSYPLVVQDSAEILRMVMKSPRYQNSMVSDYIRVSSRKEEYQFAAMKITPLKERAYIVFSGTDSSLNGWKENFNMSYLQATPSQIMAMKYLKKMVQQEQDIVRVGGHSKGGNLAIYAAVKAGVHVQKNILEVYNFDGPGFNESMFAEGEYEQVVEKIKTMIPEASVVGRLMKHCESCHIVRSSEKGILQHRAISWEVERENIVRMPAPEPQSLHFEKAFQRWLCSLNVVERQLFVDAMFDAFYKAGFKDMDEVRGMNLRQFLWLIRAADRLPEKQRNALCMAVRKFTLEMEN